MEAPACAPAEKMNLFDARLVAPGKPDSSVLLHRKAGHMPPLATAIVDDEAVLLLCEWIEEMKPLPKEPARKE
jgi:hypothetical protein